MLKYIFGWFLNFLKFRVSKLSLVDSHSIISSKARIYSGVKVFNSQIGDFSYVTKGTQVIFASIGKFCSVGQESFIGLGHHTLDKLSTSPVFTEHLNATGYVWIKNKHNYPFKKVKIGNDVWIGARVLIMGGVNVGDGAVIAAGAVVTKDVPPYSVVAGVPAKVVKYRYSDEIIHYLLNLKWWNKSADELKQNLKIYSSENITLEELKHVFK